jgi:uncharacterized membrane protein
MGTQIEQHTEGGPELERIIFFSDAVFAIAITLLILDIKVPELVAVQAKGLGPALWDRIGQVQTFASSFIVIGLYWTAHHRLFSYVRRYDGGLMWINIFFLMSVAWLPYPTSIVGRYANSSSGVKFGDQQIAVMLYTVSVIITGLLLALVWIYASRGHRLISINLSPRFIRFYTLRLLVPSALFLLSLGLAFFNPVLTSTVWWLVVLVRPVMNRIYGVQEPMREA